MLPYSLEEVVAVARCDRLAIEYLAHAFYDRETVGVNSYWHGSTPDGFENSS